jgi:hypothetical protein
MGIRARWKSFVLRPSKLQAADHGGHEVEVENLDTDRQDEVARPLFEGK